MGERVRGRADGRLRVSRNWCSYFVPICGEAARNSPRPALLANLYLIGYIKLIEIVETVEFKAWRAGLQDQRARQAVFVRLIRLAQGLFGDFRSVGEGVGELRIHVGPGYRLYMVRRGDRVVVLLHGGDKSSQARDIEKAKAMARSL